MSLLSVNSYYHSNDRRRFDIQAINKLNTLEEGYGNK